MRIVAWNVQGGGGRRQAAIAEAAAAFDADVIVLSEYRRTGRVDILRSRLDQLGYRWWLDSGPEGSWLGVGIAARAELGAVDIMDPFPPWAGLVGALIGGLTVIGVYSPGSGSVVDGIKIKGPWWDRLVALAAANRNEAAIIIGDCNNGVRGRDEAGRTFAASDRFEALSAVGWRDAWRELHGNQARASSWWSNYGNGFRVDHCFATSTIRVFACDYHHEINGALLVDPTRALKGADRVALSDHAALCVDVTAATPTG